MATPHHAGYDNEGDVHRMDSAQHPELMGSPGEGSRGRGGEGGGEGVVRGEGGGEGREW